MKNKKGFTLAEIIISMTIIGVIAAITIPALLVSTSEKALEAQKKALLARVSQAISQIDDLRIYAKSTGSGTSVTDKDSAMNFATKALSKVYRIKKICTSDTIVSGCEFPEEITTLDGSIFKIDDNKQLITYLDNATAAGAATFGYLNTNAAGIITANGESIVIYYNPNCRGSSVNGYYTGSAATAMCLNMIYDLNGKNSAPNQVGKDIGFLTVFFPKDPDIISPIPYSEDITVRSGETLDSYSNAARICKNRNRGLMIPSWRDGLSMVLNKKLINIRAGKEYVVSGAGSTNIYKVSNADLVSGNVATWSGDFALRCIYNY